MNISDKMVEVYEKHIAALTRLVFSINGSLPPADRFKDGPLSKLKLNSLQRNILLQLRYKGCLTVGEIAREEGTHQQAISKPVIFLAKLGLIRRFQKDDDFRSVYAELTDYANELLEQQHEFEKSYVLRHFYSVATVDEIQDLIGYYDKCTDFLTRLKDSQNSEFKPKRNSKPVALS